jgi:putative membrane protein
MKTRASIVTVRCILAGSALVLGGSALAADAPPTTAEVLTKLHESDQKEIQAGKMAEQNGQTQQVKDYGKMLVKDHTAADKKVTALAKQEKIDLPKAASSDSDMKSMAEMKGMTKGPDFDNKFAEDMVQDHRKDVAEVTQARDATTDPKLKKLLTDLIPTLQKHEDEAQKIVDSSGNKGK